MKINPQKIYNSAVLKKCLKGASENSALFIAGTSLALSTVARPLAIFLTPKTDEENKKHAVAKSFSSSAAGFLIMLLATKPVSDALKNITSNPKEYLKQNSIEALKNGEKTLPMSKKYNFATQLFKLGLGFLIAAPKSIMTSKMVSPLVKKMFPKKKEDKKEKTETINPINAQKIAFTANPYDKYVNFLSKGIGNLMNTKTVQNLSDKFHKTNFEQHMMNLTDILTTSVFVATTMKDKKLEEKRKKVLSINSILSTGMCVLGGLGLNKLLEKPLDKFIENFKNANKNSADLGKYLEGIRVAKSAFILGGIYYILIPVISTYFAERIEKKLEKPSA